MQQTDASGGATGDPSSESASNPEENNRHEPSVLEHVIETATGRSDVEKEVRGTFAYQSTTEFAASGILIKSQLCLQVSMVLILLALCGRSGPSVTKET